MGSSSSSPDSSTSSRKLFCFSKFKVGEVANCTEVRWMDRRFLRSAERKARMTPQIASTIATMMA